MVTHSNHGSVLSTRLSANFGQTHGKTQPRSMCSVICNCSLLQRARDILSDFLTAANTPPRTCYCPSGAQVDTTLLHSAVVTSQHCRTNPSTPKLDELATKGPKEDEQSPAPLHTNARHGDYAVTNHTLSLINTHHHGTVSHARCTHLRPAAEWQRQRQWHFTPSLQHHIRPIHASALPRTSGRLHAASISHSHQLTRKIQQH
jgi:hypothetical protein